MLDRYFWELLGADVGSVRPGEIVVVRSPRRETPERDDGLTVPLYVLVRNGRGVVSSSRFLHRVAEAWAEDFAAPDYLLQAAFLNDLHAAVERSLDAPAAVIHSRLFLRPDEEAGERPVRIVEIEPGQTRLEDALGPLHPMEPLLVLACRESDRSTARAILESGYAEYGRTVRFEVRR